MLLMSWMKIFLVLGTQLLESLLQMEDDELVELARTQDQQGHKAFEVLIERHNLWLTRLLRGLVSHPHDAEELVQNTLVRAFFALPKFRGESSFKTWLRTIASREAFNHYRSKGRRREHTTEEMPETSHHATIDEPELSDFDQLDERQHIELALAKVPYPYKEILILRYVEELSVDEISTTLELGKSATKMRLMRAREFFKTAYDEDDAC